MYWFGNMAMVELCLDKNGKIYRGKIKWQKGDFNIAWQFIRNFADYEASIWNRNNNIKWQGIGDHY